MWLSSLILQMNLQIKLIKIMIKIPVGKILLLKALRS